MAIITGTFGDDILIGTVDDDTFISSAGNDVIRGRTGVDIVDYSSLGQAVVVGIAGVISKGNLGTDIVENIETIIGANGLLNSIDGSAAIPGVSITADLSQEQLVVSGIPNLPPLTFGVQNFVNVIGTSGDDTIIGNKLDNNLQGGDGNDKFIGSAGNDTILGGNGTDIVDYSNLGQAVVVGIAGAINKGTLGTDILVNIETIIGAKGQSNSIDASASIPGVSISADLSLNQVVVSGIPNSPPLTFGVQNFTDVFGTSGDDIIIGDDLSNSLQGRDGNDVIRGNGGTDFLFGEAGNDFIDGGSGNDFLSGGAGDDLLIGGSGNDVLDGGSGNDFIVGDNDADVLTGGAGVDLFVYFNPSEGGDLILDFTLGEDKIAISASGFGSGLSVGSLSSNQFALGTAALTTDTRFIYNDNTGLLFFDQDGSGSSAQQLLAALTNIPTLSTSDFVVI